jgi:hypothetical protein
MIIASIESFLGTMWWTALVAAVSFAAGVALSSYIKAFLNRG